MYDSLRFMSDKKLSLSIKSLYMTTFGVLASNPCPTITYRFIGNDVIPFDARTRA
jgi:hypothetical protein